VNDKFLWEAAFLAAVCETDDSRVPGRILEAISAIEERLLSAIDEDELKAVKGARERLKTLKSERMQRSDRYNSDDEEPPEKMSA
jgi:hypothetical protein